ncbi:atherin-like [Piliocolobus tephrosceles]|uniref:atherin-like n=1 Tax=Piliocolobus tephrosceles TaxID=591936 RepID=UPI0013011B84|nr:atherin-like [Piliocolobus tephrosceles]
MNMLRGDERGCHYLRCLRSKNLQQSLIGGEEEVGVEKGLHYPLRTQLPRRRVTPAPGARGGPAGGREEGLPGAPLRRWRVRGGRGPYSPGPAASASAAPAAASAVHPCGGGLQPRRSSHNRRLGRPLPPAQRLSSGPLLKTRPRPLPLPPPPQRYVAAAPTSRDSLPSARGRAGPAGRAARGGQQGRGCACVDVCAGGGREGGERLRGRARARPRPLPSPAPPPNRDPDTSLRPPPRHPGLWERRRACAALGPARAHLFCLLPHCERSATQITAGSPRHPRPFPLRPLPAPRG